MRVLIVRTGALGDIVHGLPVLTALRRAHPEAWIGWLVEERWAPLLAGHADLDSLLTVGLNSWRQRPFAGRTWRQGRELLEALDRASPEVVLDLMGNHKAGILAGLSGASQRIGLARRFRREPSSAWWINQPVVPRGVHAVERALCLLDGLEIEPGPADFGGEKLFTQPEPSAAEPATPHEEPFALLHPGAGWENKRYPAAYWGQVARKLAAAGVAVRVAGGPAEDDLVARVVAASQGAARRIEAATIPALGHLLRHSRIVLGGDTGPIHLAHALGTPVLCLMGPTDPATHGPYGTPRQALAVHLPCSFCHQRLNSPRACLWNLAPRIVAERALELVASHSEHGYMSN